MISKTLLIAALGLFPALVAHASVDSILNVELECFSQYKEGTTGPNNFGMATRTRINSKDLIKMAGKATGQNFPSGAQLKAFTDGRVAVVDSKGKLLTDITPLVRVKWNTIDRVYDGKINRKTGEERSKSYFPVGIIIDLPTLRGAIDGIGKESFQVFKPDKFGTQLFKGEIDSTVSGTGVVKEKKAFYTGTLKFRGREPGNIN